MLPDNVPRYDTYYYRCRIRAALYNDYEKSLLITRGLGFIVVRQSGSAVGGWKGSIIFAEKADRAEAFGHVGYLP